MRTSKIAAALAALTGLVGAAVAIVVVSPPATVEAEGTRPNILLIATDDMRQDDLRYLPFTRRLLRREGVEFKRLVSPHPMCCPARAEMLTGQYAHNNGVRHNNGKRGGFAALTSTDELLPQWLHDVGYRTAFAGKFMNGYKGGDLPGFTAFDPLTEGVYRPYDFTSWNTGDPLLHTGVHQTDWVKERTNAWIHEYAQADAPFFIWASHLAPHTMMIDGKLTTPVPPSRYTDLRHEAHATPPSTLLRSYNEQLIDDKPRYVRQKKVRPHRIWPWHRGRVLSLYAVDDAVRANVMALKAAGEYDNTVLIFTSDNGVMMGSHRLRAKNVPYEEAYRVPFLMRGPGIPVGTRTSSIGSLVDLPATIAGLAGVEPGRSQDGYSLLDVLRRRKRDFVLVQAGAKRAEWAWRGVYGRRYSFVRHRTGEGELYDHKVDPYEMRNVAGRAAYRPVQRRLTRVYRSMRDCAGEECIR